MIPREGEKLYNQKFPDKALIKESERTTDRLDELKDLLIRLAGVIPTKNDLSTLDPSRINFPDFPDKIEVSNLDEIKFPEIQKVKVLNQKKPDKIRIVVPDPPKVQKVEVINEADFSEIASLIKEIKEIITSLSPEKEITIVDDNGKPIDWDRLLQKPVVQVSAGGGNSDRLDTINNTIKNSLENYKVSDIDTSAPNYYGFIDKDGNWYIMKEDTTANTYRYAKGSSSYTTNWTNRASLSYDYYYNVF